MPWAARGSAPNDTVLAFVVNIATGIGFNDPQENVSASASLRQDGEDANLLAKNWKRRDQERPNVEDQVNQRNLLILDDHVPRATM
jgi:hypothetical protein